VVEGGEQQPFNGHFSRTTWVSRYQKGKTNLDFTGARDSECMWHQLGHMQVCTSLQTDNHASTPPPQGGEVKKIKVLMARQTGIDQWRTLGGSVVEWLACWTEAQKGPG